MDNIEYYQKITEKNQALKDLINCTNPVTKERQNTKFKTLKNEVTHLQGKAKRPIITNTSLTIPKTYKTYGKELKK